ncbi:MAG TPA: M50 family metallopeptidase [Oligoflexia bacterium]|nr:M50 family metallopeptidase [Oligoflexia bacterium]HMP26581.1 M50 family metallopeptidase [Oligoflexia bacterium]
MSLSIIKRPSILHFELARLGGVLYKAHITLPLFLGWLLIEQSSAAIIGQRYFNLILFIGFSLALLLHELGHMLAANLLGIKLREVIIYPFGGVARLKEQLSPAKEMFYTAAGPLANLVCGILFANFENVRDFSAKLAPQNIESSLVEIIASADRLTLFQMTFLSSNLLLLFVNLIPATPFDGASLSRSGLKLLRIPAAVSITTTLGHISIAALFILAARFVDPILIGLLIFVLIQGARDALFGKELNSANGIFIAEAMIPANRLVILNPGLTLKQAAKIMARSPYNVFPVLSGNTLLGIVDSRSITERSALAAGDEYLRSYVDTDFRKLSPDDSLTDFLETSRDSGSNIALVVDKEGSLLGLVEHSQAADYALLTQLYKEVEKNNAQEEDQNNLDDLF